jgi:hypothetical protein
MIQTLNTILKLTLKYCLISLKHVKIFHYNNLICNSNNKIKTTWSIIKTVTDKRTNNTEAQS